MNMRNEEYYVDHTAMAAISSIDCKIPRERRQRETRLRYRVGDIYRINICANNIEIHCVGK